MRPLFVAIMILAAFAAANLRWTAPRTMSADENFAAKYQPSFEQERGWPLTAYRRYTGGGYINPGEWLAWDVEPVEYRWDETGVVLDAFIGSFAGIMGYFACRAFVSRPSRAVPVPTLPATSEASPPDAGQS